MNKIHVTELIINGISVYRRELTNNPVFEKIEFKQYEADAITGRELK